MRRLGAALGAFKEAGAGIVTETPTQVVPLSRELGLGELLQHLDHGCALGGADPGIEVHRVADGGDPSPPASVGVLAVVLSAISVGDALPLAHGAHERLVRVRLGEADELVGDGTHLLAAARVGVGPGELTYLSDTETAGSQLAAALRKGGDELGPVGDLDIGRPERRLHPTAH